MSNTVAMRTGKDRLRYSIGLEIGIMAFLIPAGAAFFDQGLMDIGALGLVLSLKAVLIGLIYNWGGGSPRCAKGGACPRIARRLAVCCTPSGSSCRS